MADQVMLISSDADLVRKVEITCRQIQADLVVLASLDEAADAFRSLRRLALFAREELFDIVEVDVAILVHVVCVLALIRGRRRRRSGDNFRTEQAIHQVNA